jgi:hypothetical protein
MKKDRKKKLLSRKIILVIALISLTALALVYVLKINDYYPFSKKQPSSQPVSATGVNKVKYTAATPNEQLAPSQKTQDTNTTPSAITTSNVVSIILNAAGQDAKGGPVSVAAKISGVTSGTCVISLSRDAVLKNYSANIIWEGSFYGCVYSIPFADISTGTWILNLSINQGSSSGSVSKSIMVL